MYQPAHFERRDDASLQALLRERPLASLVALLPHGMEANLVPLEFDPTAGSHGCLRGHLARANPLARELAAAAGDGVAALALFHGPQCYISPGWYASTREHGKVVPTWNYLLVQARGPLVVLDEAAAAHALVTRLTDRHEATQPKPWAVADAPAGYVASMLRAIVCIEVPLTSLVGKFKLSQNRSAEDRAGLVGALRAQGDGPAQALAERMEHPAGG